MLIYCRMVENKAIPAECWREAFICFIDLVHFCEMFSKYFSFGYRITNCPKLLKCSSVLENSSKRRVWNLELILCWRNLLWKFCPLDGDRGHCNLVQLSDAVQEQGWNQSLVAELGPSSVRSWRKKEGWWTMVLTSAQRISSFHVTSLFSIRQLKLPL